MAGIPFVIAQVLYTPVLAGLTAGILAPHSPYVAAVLARVAAAIWTVAASELGWWDSQVSGIVATPLGIPLVLWGELGTDARAAARKLLLGWVQDTSYLPAYLHTVFATLPVALRWLPSPFGFLLGWALPAALLLNVARRNRQDRTLPAGP